MDITELIDLAPAENGSVIQLPAPCLVQRVEAETAAFPGGTPACSLEAKAGAAWKELLPRQPLQAHARCIFAGEIQPVGPVTQLRLSLSPNAVLSRLRILGRVCRDGLQRWNTVPEEEARAELLACCASARWADRILAQRPFSTREDLFAAADQAWSGLERSDWMEAFGSESVFELGAGTSVQLGALQQVFQAYSERFPHTLVCHLPSGSIDELIAAVRTRLGNDPERELQVAADEQRKIGRQKLEELLAR